MRLPLAALLGSCLSCAAHTTAPPSASTPPDAFPRVVVFEGACDPSGAVSLDARFFAVGDDEDNTLRIYDADHGGPPIQSFDVSPQLELEGKRKPREADIEAATSLGERALWLTSHARSKRGKRRPERLLLFVTTLPKPGDPIVVVGRPYRALLDDLLADPRLQRFGLVEAAERSPEDDGGLNVEGLTATDDGRVLIGLRSPLHEGRALIIPVENPLELDDGQRAKLGEPFTLDLGGRGIRSLSMSRGKYLALAGSTRSSGPATRLFTWTSTSQVHDTGIDLSGFNPEGFFTPEDREEIMLLSDDGTRELDGTPCKKLPDPTMKRWRGLWVRVRATAPSPAAKTD